MSSGIYSTTKAAEPTLGKTLRVRLDMKAVTSLSWTEQRAIRWSNSAVCYADLLLRTRDEDSQTADIQGVVRVDKELGLGRLRFVVLIGGKVKRSASS